MKLRIAAGSIALVWILAAARALHIHSQFQDSWSVGLLSLLFANEAKFAAPLTLWILLGGELRSLHIARRIWIGLGITALLYFALDTGVLFALDRPASIHDMMEFAPELDAVSSFITIKSLALTVLGIALLFIHRAVSARKARLSMVFFGVISVFLVAGIRVGGALEDFDWRFNSLLGLVRTRESRASMWYPPEDLLVYPAFESPQVSPGLLKRRNVILLMVEGLSRTDSLRSGGEVDMLPEFDRLSQRGVLFTNCTASEATSAGSFIGMMQGIPPIPYPGNGGYAFPDFAPYPSLIRQFGDAGFFTEYAQGASLDFLGRRQYLEEIGFKLRRGRDEIERFQGKPRFAFNAPPDGVLYDEMLERARTLLARPEPFLQVLFTVTSHRPWVNPDDRSNDEAGVWRYVQRELTRYVDSLAAMDFFDDGVLIITGDHRKMTGTTELEFERYGDSAPTRVPLLIIGKGFEAGRIDHRLVPQYTLLSKFDELADPQAHIADFSVFVSWQRFKLSPEERSGGQLIVLESPPAGAGHPIIEGRKIRWNPGAQVTKETRRKVDAFVHSQRIFGQSFSAQDVPCGLNFDPIRLYQNQIGNKGVVIVSYPEPLVGRSEDQILAFATPLGVKKKLQLPPEELELLKLAGAKEVEVQGFLSVTEPGTYQFRFSGESNARCLKLGRRIIMGERDLQSVPVTLQTGMHELRVHMSPMAGELEWQRIGAGDFAPIPDDQFENPSSRASEKPH